MLVNPGNQFGSQMKEKISLAVSWFGAIGATLASWAHLWLGIGCATLSLIATVYAIAIARTTLRLREREYRDRLCGDCRQGDVPAECPIPIKDRPVNCPLMNHAK